jgi:hypothetical protein
MTTDDFKEFLRLDSSPHAKQLLATFDSWDSLVASQFDAKQLQGYTVRAYRCLGELSLSDPTLRNLTLGDVKWLEQLTEKRNQCEQMLYAYNRNRHRNT